MLNNLKMIVGIILPLFIYISVSVILASIFFDNDLISWGICIIGGIILVYYGPMYVGWFFKKFCKGKIE